MALIVAVLYLVGLCLTCRLVDMVRRGEDEYRVKVKNDVEDVLEEGGK